MQLSALASRERASFVKLEILSQLAVLPAHGPRAMLWAALVGL